MKISLIFASIFGFLSVILGAFAAHSLKKLLPYEKILNIETGVKYQMYNAIILLVLGYVFKNQTNIEKSIVYLFIVGTIFFSFSIYLLSIQDLMGINLKFLWPVTPIGGFLLVLAWGTLLYYFLKLK